MASNSRTRRVRPRVKVWLEVDGEHAFCPRMCDILRAVERTGSIKAAAREVGRSYRFVWGRLKHIEQSFGVSLVETHVGGATERRSSLTPAGRALVERFMRLQNELYRTADAGAADMRDFLRRHSQRLSTAPPNRVTLSPAESASGGLR